MNWTAFSIALIVGFYWARVLRLIRKARRQTGKNANLLPPEPVERALRFIWIPVVAIWMLNPFIVAFVRHLPYLFQPTFREPIVQSLCVLIALTSLIFTMACWKRMGKSWRMGVDPNEKTALIVTGPYAFARHPIYGLSSVLMIASTIAVPTPLMIGAAVVHLLLLQWEARREERYLLGVHGQIYADYLNHVGRFFPRSLSPYKPAG